VQGRLRPHQMIFEFFFMVRPLVTKSPTTVPPRYFRTPRFCSCARMCLGFRGRTIPYFPFDSSREFRTDPPVPFALVRCTSSPLSPCYGFLFPHQLNLTSYRRQFKRRTRSRPLHFGRSNIVPFWGLQLSKRLARLTRTVTHHQTHS